MKVCATKGVKEFEIKEINEPVSTYTIMAVMKD